jgi:TetR/AcrR family tetracycline transcriptional repressor
MTKSKIDRNQIVVQALKTLGTSSSFSQFSLRKVASDLHIDVSTLYWHFKNKQEILQAMAKYVVSQIEIPSTDLPWDVQLKQLFCNSFDIYQRYPFSAVLLIEALPSASIRLKLFNHTIGILTSAGIDEQTASVAVTSIDFFLSGMSIGLTTENRFKQQIENDSKNPIISHFKKIDENIEKHNLIHVQSAIDVYTEFSAKQQFIMGLDLMIAGLKQNLNQ